MALFVARPSRGSWAFFALVALAAAAARGWDRYDRAVVRRDAPIADQAREVAACFYGTDAAWVLAGDDPARWEANTARWLRRVVSIAQEPAWPARCLPGFNDLAARLRQSQQTPEALSRVALDAARDVSLMSGADAAFRRIDLADGERFAARMAGLFSGVRALSRGTAAVWRPPRAEEVRTPTPVSPTPPRLRTLSPEVTRAALASGDALTLFVARDGLTHRLDLDTGAARDRRLAPAVIVGEPRDGAARAETDQGPAWLDLGGRLLPAPDDLALLGPPAELGWDLDLADASLPYALATVDEGTATLRLTTDGASWQGPLEAGPRGAVLAATVSRDGGERVVTTLEARLSGAALVQRALRTAPALALDAPVTLEDDVPAFGARVATCASGPARYFAVATPERVTVYRVRGRRLDAAQAEMPFPSGYELGLTCEGERALVGPRPTPPRGRHLLFAFDDAPRAVPLEVPLDARGATLHAVTLLGDGAVAFVSTAGALRAYRYTPSEGRAPGRWRPAGLVALTLTPEGHTRSFTRIAARASGEHVALFVDGLVTPQAERPAPGAEAPPAPPPVRYTTVVHSRDGAGSFWSL